MGDNHQPWTNSSVHDTIVLLEKVQQLERENAALHAAIAAMPTCRCGMSTEDQCNLSVENAELREDKARLEWLAEHAISIKVPHGPDRYAMIMATRHSIDTARKASKPNA